MNRISLFCSIMLLFPSVVSAQGPSLLVDIDRTPRGGSNPEFVSTTLGFAIGVVATPSFGREPYVTDGTAAGTFMLGDLAPGAANSDPRDFIELPNGRILFAATTPTHGRELWSTDGTVSGTVQLADLRAGSSSSSPQFFARVGGSVWFCADDGVHGLEPHISDGTPAGTRLVIDSNPGSRGITGSTFGAVEFADLGGRAVFSSIDSATSRWQVWISAGTAATSIPLGVFDSPRFNTSPRKFTTVGGVVVFSGWTASTGTELFVTDGTAAGTRLLADTDPGPTDADPSAFLSDGSRCFFQTRASSQDWNLYFTDGTASGTRSMGLQISSHVNRGSLAFIALIGGDLIFSHYSDTEGRELWISDGTQVGTRILVDLDPGVGTGGAYSQRQAVLGTQLLFSNVTDSEGRELWITDGTAAGTRLVHDIAPGPASSTPYSFAVIQPMGGGQSPFAVFAASDSTHGRELWRTDGSPGSTQLVVDLAPGPTPNDSSSPRWIAQLGDEMLFTADDGLRGRELWKTDGTAAGTDRITDLLPGDSDSFGGDNALLGDRVVLSGTGSSTGTEPFITDGTEAGTMLLRDIAPGTSSSQPSLFFAFEDHVYFSVVYRDVSGAFSRELWRTDGSPSGTVRVGNAQVEFLEFFEWNGMLFLERVDPASLGRRSLYRLDLSAPSGMQSLQPPGTTLLRGIMSAQYTPFRDKLYFIGEDAARVRGVWETDGTPTGTRIATLPVAAGGPTVASLDVVGDKLLIHAAVPGGSSRVRQLWTSDGTVVGTSQLGSTFELDDFTVRRMFGRIDESTVVYWHSAPVGAAPYSDSLWRTDGTVAGTMQIATGLQKPDSTNPIFSPAGLFGDDFVLVSATASQLPENLWICDGTIGGMRPLYALSNLLIDDSSRVARLGRLALLSGYEPAHGDEAHVFDLVANGASIGQAFGTGCPGSNGVPQLGASGDARPGGGFAFELSAAAPSASAALLLGAARAHIDFGGCALNVGTQVGTIPLMTNGMGSASLPASITVGTVGLVLRAQAVVLDPAGQWFGGVSATRGFEVVVGQ